jgi:5-methylcytosine-specific restriction endonuclease McrA
MPGGVSCPKPAPVEIDRSDRKRSRESTYRRNSKLARERDHHHCRVCGSQFGLETHHLVPRSLVGKALRDERRNLVTLCGGEGNCHQLVTRHVIELQAMTDRGADGPLSVSKFDKAEGGYIVITERA